MFSIEHTDGQASSIECNTLERAEGVDAAGLDGFVFDPREFPGWESATGTSPGTSLKDERFQAWFRENCERLAKEAERVHETCKDDRSDDIEPNLRGKVEDSELNDSPSCDGAPNMVEATGPPNIDWGVVYRFLEWLGPDQHCLVAIHDGKKHPPRHWLASNDEVEQNQREGFGIFHVVQQLRPLGADGKLPSRTKENIVGVRGLFLDLDGAPVEPVLEACGEGWKPHAIVESGGVMPDGTKKIHVYWKVKGVEVTEVEKFLRRLLGARQN